MHKYIYTTYKIQSNREGDKQKGTKKESHEDLKNTQIESKGKKYMYRKRKEGKVIYTSPGPVIYRQIRKKSKSGKKGQNMKRH